MQDKEFFTLQTEHFLIEGRSRAGHETFFRVRDLNIALDIGRCPDLVVSMPHVFISHAHLDHAAGIPFYAGQRHLQQLEGGTIYVPAEAAADVEALLEVQRRLTGASFDEVGIVGVAAGEELRIGRSLFVRGHAAPHRVAARGYEFIERRHHLRGEYIGSDGETIARLRREGEEVEEEYRCPILFYTGDTDRGLLESCDALYKAEVLMIECSFVADGHQDRAAKYRHIHVDDIADFAERFENQLIVLTHFSRRYSRDEIRNTVRRRLPVSLHDRIRLGLPEQWQRLS
ncbi:MAG TPA: MBL fold metallo-hydrolase [Thermoanaerobaculia bacterium]|nr:MBL fold metallo-hydrolase [Thermoanaerobaculia bacterium]